MQAYKMLNQSVLGDGLLMYQILKTAQLYSKTLL